MSTEYDIDRAFKRIEKNLIASMMRNLERHKAEETAAGYNWEQWQAIQLRELEAYRKRNAALFGPDFQDINDEIARLFETTSKDAQTQEEARILEKIKRGDFTPAQEKDVSFFGANDGRLNAMIEATKADFTKAEFSMLRKADDEYRKIIFDAQLNAAAGSTYEQAVDMATKDFLRKGIQSIEYKDGSKHNITKYARMAIKTGNKRAYLMGEGNAHDKYGIHTVRVNKRTHACPQCVHWLGKVLIDDVYSGGTAKEARDQKLPTLSQAMSMGFLHPNCRDVYSLYLPGISKEADPWTESEIHRIVDNYNETQELNHAKDMYESYSRMAEFALDPTNKQTYQARADMWKTRIDELNQPTIPETYHEGIRSGLDIKHYTKIGYDADFSWVPQASTKDGITSYTFGEESSVLTSVGVIKEGTYKVTPPTPENLEITKGLIGLYRKYDGEITLNFTSKKGKEITRTFHVFSNPEDTGAGWRAFIDANLPLDKALNRGYSLTKEAYTELNTRMKEINKELKKRGVKLDDLLVRNGDEWSDAMKKYHTVVEADKPMSLVPKDVFDRMEGPELYRGIAKESHLRADLAMTMTPEQCAVQLVEGGVGDCFPSRGVYGDGIAYLSESLDLGVDYATGYGSKKAAGVVVRMKMKPDAKVIKYDDAVELYEKIKKNVPKSNLYFGKKQNNTYAEVGKAMQLLGFDVILEPNGDMTGIPFYVILNRNALVAPEKDYIKLTTKQLLKRLS